MKLYVDSQFLSPYAMSAYVALCEKRIDFELGTVDLGAGEQGGAAFAGVSLTRRVPLLDDGGFALNESSAIAEYLDDVYGGRSLYPLDPRRRARAREVQAWLRSDLVALRSERSTEVVFRAKRCAPLSDPARVAAHRLVEAADRLIDPMHGQLFAEWTIADTDLALMLNRLVAHGDPVPETLRAYVQKQWSRPAVQRWLSLTGSGASPST